MIDDSAVIVNKRSNPFTKACIFLFVIPSEARNLVQDEYKDSDSIDSVLAKWFVNQNAVYICIDPGSEQSRNLYSRHGAGN